MVERARLALLAGKTDAETAVIVGVSLRTFERWKVSRPEFMTGDWKAKADSVVEASLYQRAIGYDAPDVHVSSYEGHVTVTPITKHIPPDPAAAMFWLKNRKRDEWGDREPGNGKLVNINITFAPETPQPCIAGCIAESGEPRKELGNVVDVESRPSEPVAQGQQEAAEKRILNEAGHPAPGTPAPPFAAPR